MSKLTTIPSIMQVNHTRMHHMCNVNNLSVFPVMLKRFGVPGVQFVDRKLRWNSEILSKIGSLCTDCTLTFSVRDLAAVLKAISFE